MSPQHCSGNKLYRFATHKADRVSFKGFVIFLAWGVFKFSMKLEHDVISGYFDVHEALISSTVWASKLIIDVAAIFCT